MVFQARSRVQIVLGTVGIIGAMVLLILLRSAKSTAARPLDPVAQRAWDKIAPRLRDADQNSIQSVEQQLLRINDFFDQKLLRTSAFAEDALSWSGKWAFIKGKFTGDDGKGHQDFLRQAFERHLFTNDELQKLLQATVAGFLSEFEGQESALLVAIRADLSEQEFPAIRSLSAFQSEEAFSRAYRSTLAEVVPIVTRDMQILVGREFGVWVASEVATAVTIRVGTAVAARLGISGGIIASSGIATLGTGLAVGLIVDEAVGVLLRQAGYDPAAEIAFQTSGVLQQIETLLIDGDPAAVGPEQNSRDGNRGLRHELNRLREVRRQFREAAIKKLLSERSGG
jgi:hypothetical protein